MNEVPIIAKIIMVLAFLSVFIDGIIYSIADVKRRNKIIKKGTWLD